MPWTLIPFIIILLIVLNLLVELDAPPWAISAMTFVIFTLILTTSWLAL